MKLLRSHPTLTIGTLALVFIGILFVFYSWAIGDVFTEVGKALAQPQSQAISGFNLSGASKLDLRGLISTSSSPEATTTPAVGAATTTAATPATASSSSAPVTP